MYACNCDPNTLLFTWVELIYRFNIDDLYRAKPLISQSYNWLILSAWGLQNLSAIDNRLKLTLIELQDQGSHHFLHCNQEKAKE